MLICGMTHITELALIGPNISVTSLGRMIAPLARLERLYLLCAPWPEVVPRADRVHTELVWGNAVP